MRLAVATTRTPHTQAVLVSGVSYERERKRMERKRCTACVRVRTRAGEEEGDCAMCGNVCVCVREGKTRCEISGVPPCFLLTPLTPHHTTLHTAPRSHPLPRKKKAHPTPLSASELQPTHVHVFDSLFLSLLLSLSPPEISIHPSSSPLRPLLPKQPQCGCLPPVRFDKKNNTAFCVPKEKNNLMTQQHQQQYH